MTGRPGILEIVLFALAFAVSGLVVLALAWSGTGPYEDMARANGATSGQFVAPSGELVRLGLPEIADLHHAWSFYVTGGGDGPPIFTNVLFTEDEISHMVDVRHVFDAVKLAVPLGLFVIVVRLQRARARGSRAMWTLVRDGALIAAAIVGAIGLVAAFAFEQAFLLFHAVFFPQGNFLFDPATSNLIRLYPDWYWEGITFRIGVSFLAGALGVALIGALRLRGAK